MASPGHIAKQRDLAIASLKITGRQIAVLLGIEPPDLSIFYRDNDLLQAEQLQEMARFNQRVVAQLAAEAAQPEPVLEPTNVANGRAKRGTK